MKVFNLVWVLISSGCDPRYFTGSWSIYWTGYQNQLWLVHILQQWEHSSSGTNEEQSCSACLVSFSAYFCRLTFLPAALTLYPGSPFHPFSGHNCSTPFACISYLDLADCANYWVVLRTLRLALVVPTTYRIAPSRPDWTLLFYHRSLFSVAHGDSLTCFLGEQAFFLMPVSGGLPSVTKWIQEHSY